MAYPKLRETERLPAPEGVLWHRRRGGSTWRRFGTYPSVPAAYAAMLAEQAGGATGDWYACRAGMAPDGPGADGESLTTFEPIEGPA